MKHTAAVIGVGFVGRAHVDALRRLGIPVRGILGSSKERGAESTQALGLEHAYASLDELAAEAGPIPPELEEQVTREWLAFYEEE